MHRRSLFILFTYSLTILSCSSLPRECEQTNFEQTGLAEGKAGKPETWDRIEACGEAAVQSYRQGYAIGRGSYCAAAEVADRASSLGERGLPPEKHEPSDFAICDQKAALFESYQKAYVAGLARFCSVDRARNLGAFSGERGEAPIHQRESFEVCGAQQGALWSGYQSGYQDGMRRFCSVQKFSQEGYLQGIRGDGQRLIQAKLERCGMGQREALMSAYDRSFQAGLKLFCGEATLQQVAGRSAQLGGDGSLPASLRICSDHFTNIEARFLALFRKERSRFVKSHCHYEAGASRAREDAATLTEPLGSQVPAYCDEENFEKYRDGYLTEWKRVKDIRCNVTKAYDQGIKDAAQALEMKLTIPDHCPPDYKASMIRRYQEGYRYATNRTGLKPNSAD